MATFDAIVIRCQQECPGLMRITALETAQRVAREFFRETEAWQIEKDYELPADQSSIDFPSILDAGTEISRITSAFVNRLQMSGITPDHFLALKQNNLLNSTPRYFLKRQTSMEVYPTQSIANTIQMNLVVTTTENSEFIQDDVESEYREGLIAGTLFHLMSQPNKPWSNPQYSAHYRERYYSYFSRSRGKALTGNGNLQLKFNKFI